MGVHDKQYIIDKQFQLGHASISYNIDTVLMYIS